MTGRAQEAAHLIKPSFSGTCLLDESMARHTTFRIGGPAALFLECADLSDLTLALPILGELGLPYLVVGKGSNLLVHDQGFPGAIITLGSSFRSSRIMEEEGLLVAGAGVPLSRLVTDVYKEGLSGLEFAVGIPGTLGGAITMNAGTSSEGIGQHVDSITVLDPLLGLRRYRGEEVQWGYRCCSIPAGQVILEATMRLEPALAPFMQVKMDGALSRRRKSQPLDQPSAGSVFKNPEGCSVAKLIEDAGLKGRRIGGACISEKHANFIVNEGSATAQDVAGLMELVRDVVRERYGIELQQEIRFVGFPQR